MTPKVSEKHFEERKNYILSAAKQAFLLKGYEPVTMQDIVDAANISRGNLYQYFSSTEEVMMAILEDGDVQFWDYLMSLTQKHDSIWVAIEEYLDVFYEDIFRNSFGIITYEFSVTSWRNEKRLAFMNKRLLSILDYFVDFLNVGIARGQFHPQQPLLTIANFTFNITDGLILEARLAQQLESVDIKGQLDALKMYLKMVLDVKEDHQK